VETFVWVSLVFIKIQTIILMGKKRRKSQ